MTNPPFDKKQIHAFLIDVYRGTDKGWDLFGKRLKRALITERAFQVFQMQAANTTFTAADMKWLLREMLKEAGLDE